MCSRSRQWAGYPQLLVDLDVGVNVHVQVDPLAGARVSSLPLSAGVSAVYAAPADSASAMSATRPKKISFTLVRCETDHDLLNPLVF
jgi:hypothetical protein